MQPHSRNVWIAIGIVILVIAGGAWYYMRYTEPTPAPETEFAADETSVRRVVTDFGTRLQQVSLQGPDEQVKAEIQANYSPYVSSDLLQDWLDNTSITPGRITSSPYPDHIDIRTVTKNFDGSYTVEGSVIEKSNGSVATTSYPITITLRTLNGAWKITDVVSDLIQVDEEGNPIIEVYKG